MILPIVSVGSLTLAMIHAGYLRVRRRVGNHIASSSFQERLRVGGVASTFQTENEPARLFSRAIYLYGLSRRKMVQEALRF